MFRNYDETNQPYEKEKRKITTIQSFNKNSKRKVQTQKLQHIKRRDNKFHIHYLIQAFSYIESCG